ncbi:MAG: HEAT repeat domain-containing protein [Promethearchaeota archaeon]|nr:MAG: HEAT repeat domain-containing protein [Candidatus Lokiarchaeota archaeon]
MVDPKIRPQEIFEKREQFGLNNSIKMLTEIIEKEKEYSIRKDAIKVLGKMSDRSVEVKKQCYETLENLLISDDNIDIKCSAAKVLGSIEHEKALKPLTWILEQENTTNELKEACLKAIADIRFQEPEIELFIKELGSKSPSIKETVKNELLTLSPDILIKSSLEALNREDFSEKHKSEIVKLIGLELASINVSFEDLSYLQIKYPEIIELLKLNKNLILETIVPVFKEDNPELIQNSLSILKILGKAIHKDLIKFLKHDDFIIKKNAINLIGKLQIKDAVGVLLTNLDDMYDEVNKAIIEALGNIGELSAIPELLNILNIEDYHYEYIDFDMKWEVLDAIKQIYLQNENASYDFLLSNLKTDSDILKESIAFILGELGNENFVDPLLNLLNERNFDTKKNAAIALGKIGNTESIDPLLNLVEDRNTYWLLKKVIIDAIFNIYLKNLFEESKRSVFDDKQFVQTTEKIIDYLKNHGEDHCRVKLSAIKLLEVFGGKTALDVLLKQLDDFHRIVRINSSKAIKKIEKRIKKKENQQS